MTHHTASSPKSPESHQASGIRAAVNTTTMVIAVQVSPDPAKALS
jgi:hypothetical protein